MDGVPTNHVSSCQPPLKNVAAQLIRYYIYTYTYIIILSYYIYIYMHLQRQRSGNDPMSEIHDHDLQDLLQNPAILETRAITHWNVTLFWHWTIEHWASKKFFFSFRIVWISCSKLVFWYCWGVPHATFLAAYPMEGRLARLKSMNSTVDGCVCSRICLNRADEARRKDWTCHGMSPTWHPEEFRNQ